MALLLFLETKENQEILDLMVGQGYQENLEHKVVMVSVGQKVKRVQKVKKYWIKHQ